MQTGQEESLRKLSYKLLSGLGGKLVVSDGASGSLLLEGRDTTCYSGWKDSGGIPGMRTVGLSLHLQTPCGWPLGGLGDYIKGWKARGLWEG